MRPSKRSIAVGAILLVSVFAARAEAKLVRFLGPHPVAAKFGGGYCYIEAPHLHAYAPDHPALYHQQDGAQVFVGDPTPFGYDGPKHPFYGHHPIAGAAGNVYCYIDGPHSHSFAPPEAEDYRIDKGVAFYVGPFQPNYYQERPHRVKLMREEEAERPFQRPTVEVRPPPEWHGEIWVAPPSVELRAPGVVVAPPVPHVVVRAPGVLVPPPPRVVVEAPFAGPGVIVRGHHGEWDRERHESWEHEHHEGWGHERRREHDEPKHWDKRRHDR